MPAGDTGQETVDRVSKCQGPGTGAGAGRGLVTQQLDTVIMQCNDVVVVKTA